MPITRNGYYNNPAIGQAFANISNMFAPPAAGDMANYAKAKATREAAKREADVFAMFTGDEYDRAAAERAAIGAGIYSPTQSFYSVDEGNRVLRDNNAADNARALQQTGMEQSGQTTREMLQPVGEGQTRFVPPSLATMFGVDDTQVGTLSANQGETVVAPDGTVLNGQAKPLTMDQWLAQQAAEQRTNGTLSDADIIALTMGDVPVEQTVGADGKPVFTRRSDAVGQEAYKAPETRKVDNYLAVGPDGNELRFLGYVGEDGQIHDVNTGQPVPDVLRREGTAGGMSFETDGQGRIRLSTGNAAGQTTARTTELQRNEAEAGRAVRELTTLFDTLGRDDLGVSGNVSELLTNYGAQMFPTLARPDVAATRAQLRATTLGLARALVQDERLSDGDRKAAKEVMVSDGLGESLPGARAKLAALIALNAYRAKYANTIRTGGESLPPLDGPMLGRLVDEDAISPRVAQVYAETVLQRSAPPNVAADPASGPAGPGNEASNENTPPPGVDPEDWRFMTPEEKALFR